MVGLGEALYDVYADRQVLGGAPLNVAVHAHQMGAGLGGQGVPASRVGPDELGRRLIDELRARAIPTSGLQLDPERPTGTVLVTLEGKEPTYEIVADRAWDRLEFTAEWKRLAGNCGAVCFGSLGQRSPQSRATIRQFLQQAPRAIRMFDVNLRQEFFTADLIAESCALATVVKLNAHELPQVCRLLAVCSGTDTPLRQASILREQFRLDAVVLTRGVAGTLAFTAAGIVEGEPAHFLPSPDADSVGAGDACAAGILMGMLLDWPDERTLTLANAAGAFVAAQPGATPQLPRSILESVTR